MTLYDLESISMNELPDPNGTPKPNELPYPNETPKPNELPRPNETPKPNDIPLQNDLPKFLNQLLAGIEDLFPA